MNLFDQAVKLKAEADSKKRSGRNTLKETLSIAHFKGVVRRGDQYTPTNCKHAIKPLSGAAIITICTCLALFIVKDENERRKKGKKQLVSLDCYLVEAFIAQQGFALDEYRQGKVAGAKRIASHLNAVAKRGVKVEVTDDLAIKLDERQACEAVNSL